MASDIPCIIGHRGAPSHLPEHTAESYRLAIAHGADLVEPDVVPTRDGVLLVRHESHLDESTDVAAHPEFAERRRTATDRLPGWHSDDFTWAELQTLRAVERLPQLRPQSHAHSGEEGLLRLRELVALVDAAGAARGRHCGLVIELKSDAMMCAAGFDYVEMLGRELADCWDAPALRGVRFESFEAPLLDRLQAASWWPRLLDAKRIVLVEDADLVRPCEEGPSRCTDAGLDDAAARFDGVSVRTTLLDADLVSRAHARGLEVLTYTLRGEDTFLPPEFAGRAADYWQSLAATGVDAVFADDPRAVRAALSCPVATAS
ncbi:glycerophosphodiester phosphodiesterase family protein [Gulosibacter bifidus]|uniref:glycerophosphodiester phosphodiesterase n=1 Tax=Gulosibacter bifidus TaxID=272239 RepID=A0ABW5RH80_9MICO|nr:glycerophosphodiester phosphodiesterase family protein [Gulosibacter bifidus]